jgi:hypothetical protein
MKGKPQSILSLLRSYKTLTWVFHVWCTKYRGLFGAVVAYMYLPCPLLYLVIPVRSRIKTNA